MARILFLAILLSILAATPVTAFAANTSLFQIVPEECETCPCNIGGVLEIVQNLMNLGIAFAVLIAVLMVVWAGFLLVTSPASPENRGKARGLLLNTAIGLLIVLSSWLVIDAFMRLLYSGPNGNEGVWGPWNSIVVQGGEYCIVAKPQGSLFGELGQVFSGETPGTVETVPPGAGPNCPAGEPSKMVAFPAEATQGETEKATPTTVQNFLSMRTAALKEGIDLKVTDGFRSEEEQVSLWNNRGSIGAVAKPCSLGGNGSNHNSGTAIDINVGCRNGQSDCNTKAYQWLKENGANWGFRNALPTDPVHWSPTGR